MQPAPLPAVLEGINLHPADVREALESLEEVSLRLRAQGDYRAVFPDVYGIVTRFIVEEIDRGEGYFQEPEFISRLDGRFCERYLETLAWSLSRDAQDCTAWGVAYEYGERSATIPFQDAILGISAHINFDLARAIYQTIHEFGTERNWVKLARYKHDHDAVNDVLKRSMPVTFEHLIDRYGCLASGIVWNRLRWPARHFILHTLSAWREHVWSDVLRLIHAKGEPGRAPVLVQMEARSGRLGRFFTSGSEALLRSRPFTSLMNRFVPIQSFRSQLTG